MTPEIETSPPAAVRSGGEGDTTTTRGHKNMSESSTSNRGQGQVRDSHVVITGRQGRGGKGRCFNHLTCT